MTKIQIAMTVKIEATLKTMNMVIHVQPETETKQLQCAGQDEDKLVTKNT